MDNKKFTIPKSVYTVFMALILLILGAWLVLFVYRNNDEANTSVQTISSTKTYVISDYNTLYSTNKGSLVDILNLKQGAKHRSSQPVSLNVSDAATHKPIALAIIPNEYKIKQTSDRVGYVVYKTTQKQTVTLHYTHKWDVFDRTYTTDIKLSDKHVDRTIIAPAQLMVQYPLG